jgi:site-specific recombinase XerD
VYRRELDRFAEWLGAATDVRRVTPDRLARYLTEPSLQVTPAGTKRSARTMNRTRTVLRLLFSYLTLAGTLRHDPSRLLKNARTDRPTPTPMSEAEERRFTAALDRRAKSSQGRRNRALVTLLPYAGRPRRRQAAPPDKQGATNQRYSAFTCPQLGLEIGSGLQGH